MLFSCVHLLFFICFSFYLFSLSFSSFFFFNDTATTEIYTLSLHDALPIYSPIEARPRAARRSNCRARRWLSRDRKSTRLNSSHVSISYAVFCLKKKKKIKMKQQADKNRQNTIQLLIVT